jgi:60 kDa SS-A/Ro ribonucleoprotein
MDYSKHVNVRKTPQSERTPGRDEVQNNAGGFVHQVDDWDRLDRFLILGTEGGTFYVKERPLTKENAEHVIGLIKSDGLRVVNRVVDISKAGRAHKNDSALFVLAAAMKLGNEQTRKLAAGVLPMVARTGTHLFTFAQFVEAFGGWGRITRRAFSNWYVQKPTDKLAVQMLKYRQRDGWSHRDILRLAHPVTDSLPHQAIFDVACHPERLEGRLSQLPAIYAGYEKASRLSYSPDPVLVEHYGLSWEMLPTEWLSDRRVNVVLLKNMPLMATIRQLGKMSANGTIVPGSETARMVARRLRDQDTITKSRIHPMHYLLAIKNYGAGKGFRGDLTWKTDSMILDALDEGFERSFTNVEPTGKSFLIGVDVSSSMTWQIGNTNISAAEASGAMAVVIARTEQFYHVHGFTCSRQRGYGVRESDLAGFIDLGVGAKDSIDSAMNKVQKRNFGGTDCALPMLYALEKNLHVDTFVVLTDNETWAGNIKPVDALNEYRRKRNPAAKLVVVGMTSNGFSIADPNDAGMLDVVGFDANVLPLISEFSR